MEWDFGDGSPVGFDPVVRVIDAIEKGVAKDKDIIYPSEAKLLYLWRALFPRLWWKTVMGFEK